MKLDASDIDELRPILRAVAIAVLEELRPAESAMEGRIAYPEDEAAALFGVPKHVLRDARYRGQISGKRLGNKTFYSVSELRRFYDSLRDA